ncbi:MAG TPA: acylneuraminate cytidylyltransferase family protein [Spirochaetales bacterium]|nr:acylneuraminate cytidylyltransferase family protein [Spirochaetales bacterium]HRY53122.1 acylneuraminate cytidylyltransferase family protein [Spirochaetia bacterium]HRZ64661.1 acylneuraminate cytidylyltransferase family protein [Spirochaetia bacterium]
MNVTCFLPCRSGSQRVPKKNVRPFAGFKHGLVEIKLNQLIRADLISKVILSTDDLEIMEYARSLGSAKIEIHERTASLASSQTSTDSLVAHAVELIPSSIILWTHVTSPFVGHEDYDSIVKAYFQALENGYDSLMTTTAIQDFLWSDDGPINYDRSIEKWPRTQTLKPVHEVNSAAFVASSDIYKAKHDRIGDRPLLFPMDQIKSFDIDWPDDFKLAECMVSAGLASGIS